MKRAKVTNLFLPDEWAHRFHDVQLLGHGGMGVVYTARDSRDGKIVALKTLRSRSPEQIEQLKAEFRAATAVYHRNVVRAYDFCSSDSVAAYTMEYISGRTIQEALIAARSDSEDHWRTTLFSLLTQVAEGLQALHTHGMVHRDIKPSNILVDARGRAVILDFGLACMAGARSGEAPAAKGGTPPYLPPEAHRGAEPSPAFDAYSFGVLLYELVCGMRPHKPEHDTDWLLAKQHVPQVLPFAPLPDDLTRMIRSLLLPDPLTRAPVTAALAVLRHCQVELTPTQAPAMLLADPDADASSHSLQWLSDVGSSGPTALLGRDEELGRLRRQWLRVEADGAQIVVVTGEAGSGKTALAQRFVQQARERSALALYARCRADEAVPFRSLDPIIVALCHWSKSRDAKEMAAVAPRGAWALARLFPVLRTLPGAWSLRPDDAPTDGNAVTSEAQTALRQWLTNLTRLTQLIICLDDVQVDDVDTVRLLMPVLTHVETPQMLWMFVARHDEQLQSRLLQSMAAAERELVPRSQVWRLRKLSESDLRQLAALQHEQLTQRGVALGRPLVHKLSEADLQRAMQVSRGNPLWFLQIIRLQALSGRTVGADWSQLVRHFVDMLGTDEREVLELLSVSRHKLSLALLQESYQGESNLRDVVQRLAHLRVVSMIRDGDETLVTIEQERLAQVLNREFVPQARARDLHKRLAQAMSAAQMFEHPDLFYHHANADERQSAAELAVSLARGAKANHSYVQAEALYQRALDLGHVVARAELAEVKCLAGNFAAGAHAWLDVAARDDESMDLRVRLSAAEAIGAAAEALARAGQYSPAASLLDRLVRSVGLVWPSPLLQVMPRLGWKQRLGVLLGLPMGRPHRPPTPPVSVAVFPHPEAQLRAQRMEVLWRAWRWAALLGVPRHDDLLELLRRDAEHAVANPVALLLQTMQGLAAQGNDAALGATRAALARIAARDAAGHGWMADWWLLLAESAARHHRWEAALDAAERGLQCCNRAGDAPISRLRLWQVQAEALVGCGKLDALYRLTAQGVPALHVGGDVLRLWTLRSGCHAFAYLARGEDGLLFDVLQQTASSSREVAVLQWSLQRAQLELALYQQQRVEAVLERLAALPEANTPHGKVLRGRAALALAWMPGPAQARAAWRSQLEAVVAELAQHDAPLYRGWRAALEGGLALLDGRTADAPQHLATAEALFRLGHQPLLAAVTGWYVAEVVGYERERDSASNWLVEHGVRDVERFCHALLPLPEGSVQA